MGVRRSSITSVKSQVEVASTDCMEKTFTEGSAVLRVTSSLGRRTLCVSGKAVNLLQIMEAVKEN